MQEKSLDRFHSAQERDYEHALNEIRTGHKRSHWMWYIFPQIAGLGSSETSEFYAITDRREAEAYRNDPVLGARLLKISKALLELKSSDAEEVMGHPDNLKLRSCMTLFHEVDPEEEIFGKVLEKFFKGEPDESTLKILKQEKQEEKEEKTMESYIFESRWRTGLYKNLALISLAGMVLSLITAFLTRRQDPETAKAMFEAVTMAVLFGVFLYAGKKAEEEWKKKQEWKNYLLQNGTKSEGKLEDYIVRRAIKTDRMFYSCYYQIRYVSQMDGTEKIMETPAVTRIPDKGDEITCQIYEVQELPEQFKDCSYKNEIAYDFKGYTAVPKWLKIIAAFTILIWIIGIVLAMIMAKQFL